MLILSALTLISPMRADDIVLESPPQRATLVELYSSEGCSSCPPAEKWISQLKSDPQLWKQIVPVVFHVDYWDGLGWPDRFARRAYTQRQNDYAARWGASNVYTPEFVVDAREWHAWFGGGALPMAKAEAVGSLRAVVQREGGGVRVSFGPVPSLDSLPYTINVAWLGVGIGSNVGGGENSGRTLVHDFVVLDFQSKTTGTTDGKGISAEFSGPNLRAGNDRPGAVAVWVSAADGSIVQATGGWVK